ncbi:hypothetical protein BDV41DRAFT_547389 [Aspergillus transmontanensis]|uniref:Uncharacterized protein n=1 Tax=Aspergillus transmontanensis TaxID=1034304 RepID=A0A5N6VMG1_9EURO|nr:hypothetical protein BDV41DRAFT_547389 [Aspergillus transmontanensis]
METTLKEDKTLTKPSSHFQKRRKRGGSKINENMEPFIIWSCLGSLWIMTLFSSLTEV